MIPSLVRNILKVYLLEKRILWQGELPSESLELMKSKDALFITLYAEWKVIASAGRIMCTKENTLAECLDLTFLLLKDPRFKNFQSPENLDDITIRVDKIGKSSRRMLQSISDLKIRDEGLIFLSEKFGKMSVILPNMVNVDPTPEKYLTFACMKADLNINEISPKDYVIYGLSTVREDDFE